MGVNLEVIDYSIIFLTIIASAVIGLCFGCIRSKQKSEGSYMYGNRNFNALPIGLSIFSSCLSGIGMLGIPSEIYIFGIQYIIHVIGIYLSVVLISTFILPVFNGNQTFKAPYEYYEQRFNKTIRILSSLIYAVQSSLVVPIMFYSCSIFISEAIDINLFTCSTILGIICIIYTIIGGFVAVIWTDVLQAMLMLITLVSVAIVSVKKAGDIDTIWTRAEKGGRINFFDFNINPFKRLNFWSAIIGTMTNFMGHPGCSASILQRYLSVKTENEARISLFIGMSGIVCNTIMGSIIGLSMYAIYHGYDPVANNELKNYNQLTSNFTLNMTQNFPGLTGILIAGISNETNVKSGGRRCRKRKRKRFRSYKIHAPGLSSMSSELNTLSGIIYYDIIQNYFKREKNGVLVMKLLVFMFGAYFILMVLAVQKIQFILPIAMMFSGTTSGLKLGLLLLGTTFPKANSLGALCGIIIAGVVMSWITINAIVYNVGSLETLPVFTDNCTSINTTTLLSRLEYFNSTTNGISSGDTKSEPFFIYKLSFLYYNLFGTIILILVALIVSYAVGVNDSEKMNPKLFIPCVRPKKHKKPKMVEMQNMLKNNED